MESERESSHEEEKVLVNLEAIELFLSSHGYIKYARNQLNLIALPLIILSVIGVGFLLVWAENILVPFVISMFFTYLIRPIVNFLNAPFRRIKIFNQNCLPFNGIVSNTKSYGNLPQNEPSTPQRVNQLLPDSTEHSYLLEENDNNGKTKDKESLYYNFEVNLFNRYSVHSSAIGCPRLVSAIMALMISVMVFIGLIVFFIDAIQEFEENNWKNYENRAIEIAIQFFSFLKKNFDIDGSKIFNQVMNEVKVFQITTSLVYYLSDFFGYTFIVFLFMLYMLMEEELEQPSLNVNSVRRQIDTQIQNYIIIKTLISAIVGFLIYLILGPLLNVKLANVFGVITFLANFIPNVGAVVATLLPLPVLVLDQDQTTFSVLLAIILPVGIHTVVGNFVEPKVFGDTMELHAVVVLLSLSLWFSLWGIPGAILAVPISAVVRIVLSHTDHTYAKVVLRLLEGKMSSKEA